MKQNQMWGWGLLALGVLALLQTLGVSVVGWVWGVLFAAGGLLFLGVYQQDNTRWWALIPGFTLLGLGALLLFEPLLQGSTEGALFLAAIGAGFLATYLVRRSNWWALIPAGTLLTLALVAWQGDRGGGRAVLLGSGRHLWGSFLDRAALGGLPAAGLLGADALRQRGAARFCRLGLPAGAAGCRGVFVAALEGRSTQWPAERGLSYVRL